jgi:hypothetical protein
MAMNDTLIPLKMHKQDKLRIFSNSQKGFVAGVSGCIEHAVMTQELMAHAIHNKQDLHMIQIDFSNAFGSIPHGLIAHNMESLGLPSDQIAIVMNISKGETPRISVQTGISEPIEWRSGTVHGCPLSPTLFNICLEPFLRLMEKPEWKKLGFSVKDAADNIINKSTNTAAYADDLILYAETRDGAQAMLTALSDFCLYSDLDVNTKKCVSVSITWKNGIREDFYAPFRCAKVAVPWIIDACQSRRNVIGYATGKQSKEMNPRSTLDLPLASTRKNAQCMERKCWNQSR